MIKSFHCNFYVDDFLMSLPDEKTAVAFISAINCLLAEGGFRLHKWMSKSRKVIRSINPTERAGSVKEITGDSELPSNRALGMNWNVESDLFIFDVDVTQKETTKGITRRHMLSTAASLFDPLGFLAHILRIPKLVMQQLCRMKLDWDDAAPDDLKKQWLDWIDEMPLLKDQQIRRCLKPPQASGTFTTELHYFSDASESAYGAVCYVKLSFEDGTNQVSFLIGKSRLAPIKLITIPRLELSAAVLSFRLHEIVLRELEYSVSRVFFWSDSMTVLQYIRNTTSRFKTFVANRLAIIQELTSVNDWRHIEGKLNPADLASRGFMPSEQEQLNAWLEGPMFLKSSEYPEETASQQSTDDDTEALTLSTVLEEPLLDTIVARFSNLDKLKRVLMNCLIFSARCRKRFDSSRTVELQDQAERILMRHSQEKAFCDDMIQLESTGQVSTSRKIPSSYLPTTT